jgi:UDP-sugar transporter A1/2/3
MKGSTSALATAAAASSSLAGSSSAVNTTNDDASGQKALLYCTLLALQYGLQPILAKRFSSPHASKNSIVIATELMKIGITATSMFKESPLTRSKLFASWSFIDYLKIAAAPAALYAVQNLMMQYGYTMLDSMTVNLLNQTKTLSAAFFLYVLLGNKQSFVQIFALVLLLIAAVTLTSGMQIYENVRDGKGLGMIWGGGDGGDGHAVDPVYLAGTTIILGASAISGLSTALTQKALKTGRHALVFSAELAVFGILVLVVTDWCQNRQLFQEGGPFKGWTLETLIPVASNAAGGIIVGLVTKYAGGVTKGFALIAGILVTAVADYMVYGTPLGPQHFASASLVSLSIYLHSSFKYVETKKKRD